MTNAGISESPGDRMAGQIAFFNGVDADGLNGLWVTNGTAAGTFELGGLGDAGISGAYTGGIGVAPSSLTFFNGEALFLGADAADDGGLWVTNGTAAGTYELGGLGDSGISGASAGGLDPQDMTVFNGEVLFNGFDAARSEGLWVTNGTAAGTFELGGLANSGIGGREIGLDPRDLTVFNGEVLFEGFNGEELPGGLWVTDGTTAGTHELTGIAGAASGYGLNPQNMTVFNGEVLFESTDVAGNAGLWVTNGTAAGTFELTGINGAYSGGLDPAYFAILSNEVLFDGTDTGRQQSLWVTNGTAAGTYELTGISGASTYGILGVPSPGLITFNGEVLFGGVDTVGYLGLWVTNGTAAGTYELTGISGASTGGLEPRFFSTFDGEVLFDGAGTAGGYGLWVTNGTGAGTYELTGIKYRDKWTPS
jgi:ELWxxDGT repeat protein